MPEPLILPAPPLDPRQPLRDRGRSPERRGSSRSPVGVAAILILAALIASLAGAGLAYRLRQGLAAEPASPARSVEASG